ncbi:unnamed protein product [Lactuca saligna]|uniref:Helitron helicase-like domain-containing protein n=1 Tax=Lactuca saligna TaxID=75948 RepID=A0AA35V6M9_LACSI|nr:unnamed protein product [Lactuca saligna]
MALPSTSRLEFRQGVSSSALPASKRGHSPRLAMFPTVNLPSPLPVYDDLGDSTFICQFCSAFFWYAERVLYLSEKDRPCYTRCCRGGGPYVFKVSGQLSHSIGSFCPNDGKPPRFLQLYMVDTQHELSNRLAAFQDPTKQPLDPGIVELLMAILTLHNEYVRTFKTVKQIAEERNLDEYVVCIFNDVPDRRYTPPAPGTLGCIVFGDDCVSSRYDILIHSKGGQAQRVSNLHPSYMPLQYPLLFPYGEDGWSPRLKLFNESGSKARNLTVNMYYSYQIHARCNIHSLILNSCRLFQQFLVDAYTCIEQSRLEFYQNNQEHLRSDFISGIYDALSNGDTESRSVGRRVLLPPSFVGGPRYMYSHYQDALSICREHGNPQYFITFTCNVKWPEIRRYMLLHNQNDVHSRADIISRVFHMKVKTFIRFLKEDKTFGPVVAHLYTIEFQKRGLPHCHTLLWVAASHKIQEPSDIDAFVTAELPDPSSEPLLYHTITTCMIHGPCGLLNVNAPCMKDDKCKKKFPKPFQHCTTFDKEGYAHYKRDCVAHHTLQNGIQVDNRYVVPYNKRLCSRFDAHINVEYCGWNMMIKYLFKYVSKGMERVRFVVQKNVSVGQRTTSSQHIVVDEIRNFVDGRYLCPHEAAWRIFDFPIHEREPSVTILPVHLPDKQTVYFKENTLIHDVVQHPDFGYSLLLGWFENNKWESLGTNLTYVAFPTKYWWDKDAKIWKRRKRMTSSAIGRLIFVHPSAGELFYLRMLLCHQVGCTSYEDIRTVCNKVYPNFRAACDALGLIGEDKEWMTAFTEASEWATSFQLRSLFCRLLLHCDVSDPMSLWEIGWRKMSDDLLYNINSQKLGSNLHIGDAHLQQLVLFELEGILQSSTPSKSVTDFHLPNQRKRQLDYCKID